MSRRHTGRGSSQNSVDDVVPTSISATNNVRLANFDGDPAMLEFFILQLKELAKINKWNEATTLFHGRNYLQGPARTFFVQRNEYDPINSLNDFFSALRTYFKKPTLCHAINEFNAISLLPGESIRNMSHRLDSLTPKAHPSVMDKTALNSIKFNKFLSIIPSDFRRQILQSNINSYVEAVEKAVLLQECEVTTQAFAQNTDNTPIQQLKDEISNLKESLNNINSNNNQEFHNRPFKNKHASYKNYRKTPHVNNKQNNFRLFQRKFNNNKNFHHNKRNFRPGNLQQNASTPNAGPISHNQPLQQFAGHSAVICQFCYESGHEAKFCPRFKDHFVPLNRHLVPLQGHVPISTPMCMQSTQVRAIAPATETTNALNVCLNPNATPFNPSQSSYVPNW